MKNKALPIAILLSVALVSGALLYVGARKDDKEPASSETVSVANGTQIIDVLARGGYSPRKILAQASVPTVLRLTTQNTYDCSIALTIPKLKYRKFLPSSGVTDIEVTAEQAKGTLRGICSMGMYSFEVNFE